MSQTLDIEFIGVDLDVPTPVTSRSSDWIVSAIETEGFELGDLAIYFCSDEHLLKLNIEHLDHDTYTDIITFDHTFGAVVSGELYISVDRVKDNAEKFDAVFERELHRVMIHGVLHLMGYGDKSEEEVKVMREKENHCLSRL